MNVWSDPVRWLVLNPSGEGGDSPWTTLYHRDSCEMRTPEGMLMRSSCIHRMIRITALGVSALSPRHKGTTAGANQVDDVPPSTDYISSPIFPFAFIQYLQFFFSFFLLLHRPLRFVWCLCDADLVSFVTSPPLLSQRINMAEVSSEGGKYASSHYLCSTI